MNTGSAPHSMAEIDVRQLRFKFDDATDRNPAWRQSRPELAMPINALGVHVTHLERFLVKVRQEYRDNLNINNLKEDAKKVIGQAVHHAFNVTKWTEYLVKRYPEAAPLDEHAKEYFAAQLNRDKRFEIGFTAGYETFTVLAGLIILGRYEELKATTRHRQGFGRLEVLDWRRLGRRSFSTAGYVARLSSAQASYLHPCEKPDCDYPARLLQPGQRYPVSK